MPVKEVSDGRLKQELERAGDKLVLVDFFATWCGPCKMVAPAIEKLSDSHPNAVFLKVDVDKCQTETQQYDISAMPTFVFFRHSKELDRIRGADTQAIEATLAKYYKETVAFGGEGHSMLGDGASSAAGSTISANDYQKFERVVRERFGNVREGQTMTSIRLRFPDLSTPINIRLGTDRTLNDIRRLLCEVIPTFEVTPFEFMEPPAMKIKLDDEMKTISEAKLLNAVLSIKKVL